MYQQRRLRSGPEARDCNGIDDMKISIDSSKSFNGNKLLNDR